MLTLAASDRSDTGIPHRLRSSRMAHFSRLLDTCDRIGHLASELGLGLLEAEDSRLDGRTLQIGGRSLRNFSSCSYLGLELDERLIEGAIDATRRFGTQFSMSRAFASAPPYAELESLLEEITDRPCLVLPSTTSATNAALPSLIDDRDAVVVDQQVHMSVQAVLPTLGAIGAAIEFVPHAGIDRLESRLIDLEQKHRRVWFLLDGVFSMHGDIAPFEALDDLMARHPALHLYVDDAHGTSWTGRNGRGVALERIRHHDRAVVALSLNKSFGAGGGALCFPDRATKQRVRHVSGPTNFGGPLQPPMLGAAVASARLHLSPALAPLQRELHERIEALNRRAIDRSLPLVAPEVSVPIRFIGLGPQAAAIEMARALMDRGFMAGCALFPAVPADQTGIRLTVTRHQTLGDLDDLIDTIDELLPGVLARAGIARDEIDRRFGLKSWAPCPT